MTVELDMPEPLRDCSEHSETICVRDCCGIDAISQEPALVAEWGRQKGHQAVLQALRQVEDLIVQVQDRARNVSSSFLNACTCGDGEGGRGEFLSFLQTFKAALRSIALNEVLTVEEIKARFDAEWILVEDPKVTPQLEVIGGRVLYHSADRDEVYQKAVELRPKHSAYLYTGQMPEHICLNVWKFFGSAE